MVMGWAVALAVISLILRHGAGAEALAWSVLFGLTPFAAVFYPVSVLPVALQWVAFIVPASHVFEGMRAALGGVMAWDQLGWALVMNVLWLAGAAWIFRRQFQVARTRGALMTIGE
jgi:ABC-2 type transport system permease protein